MLSEKIGPEVPMVRVSSLEARTWDGTWFLCSKLELLFLAGVGTSFLAQVETTFWLELAF